MAFHSFSLPRALFFRGGWLPGNSKYNCRNVFIWHESLKQGEGTEHHAMTKLRISLRNPRCSGDCWESYTQYFIFASFPALFPSLVRKEDEYSAGTTVSFEGSFSGVMPAIQEIPLFFSHAGRDPGGERTWWTVPVRYQGAPHSPSSTPTSLTPFLPILFLPYPYSSFPHL